MCKGVKGYIVKEKANKELEKYLFQKQINIIYCVVFCKFNFFFFNLYLILLINFITRIVLDNL